MAHWHHGRLRQARDEDILIAALEADLLLVSYDVGTIPAIVHDWLAEGRSSPQVALIHSHAIRQQDIGGIVAGIIALYDGFLSFDQGYPILYMRLV